MMIFWCVVLILWVVLGGWKLISLGNSYGLVLSIAVPMVILAMCLIYQSLSMDHVTDCNTLVPCSKTK